MKPPTTKREAVEKIAEMYKEIKELEEIVAGARLNEENLLNYLTNICALIYYQWPLKAQDAFVAEMIDIGLYDPMADDYDEDDVIGLA
tara:strand:- start:852 stop:1115 length:264 start_codon:yes stop_codon:yes gene_type:complete